MDTIEINAKVKLEKEIGLSSIYYDCALLNCLKKQKLTTYQNILAEYNLIKENNVLLKYALFRTTLFFGLISNKLCLKN